jgi:hypothetical protein
MEKSNIPARYSAIHLTLAEAQRAIVKKNFRRTLLVAESLIPHQTVAYFTDCASELGRDENGRFVEFMQSVINRLPNGKRSYLKDVFELERACLKMDTAVDNFTWLHIKETVQAKQAERVLGLDAGSLSGITLRLREGITLLHTDWNWSFESEADILSSLNKLAGDHTVLLKATATGVFEKRISPFVTAILTAFRDARCVRHVIEEITTMVEATTAEEYASIREMTIEQIKQAVAAGILVDASGNGN